MKLLDKQPVKNVSDVPMACSYCLIQDRLLFTDGYKVFSIRPKGKLLNLQEVSFMEDFHKNNEEITSLKVYGHLVLMGTAEGNVCIHDIKKNTKVHLKPFATHQPVSSFIIFD